jgi:hypothetical protein
MRIRSRYVAVVAATGLLLVVAACDKKSPTSPAPPPPGPTSTASVVRLELIAPPEIAPGESVQLTANAIKSDGSVENVSNQATWTTYTPVVEVSSTGLATGKNRGEAYVYARFARRDSAGARIFVLPTGTFRLAGTIQDSGFGIAGVTVTVTSGIGEGLTTLSRADGFYALYGVSGPVQLQVKKEGYSNAIQSLDVTAHRTYDFNMVTERPRTDYRGTYTLTISAASPCRSTSGTFPEEAKRRVYTANVEQDAARLTVTLSDADFIVTNGYGNRFSGFTDPTGTMTFPIGEFWGGEPIRFDIVERFSGGALLVSGTVSASGTPQRIAGTLNGSILISNRTSAPFEPFNASCESETHGFEMVRR